MNTKHVCLRSPNTMLLNSNRIAGARPGPVVPLEFDYLLLAQREHQATAIKNEQEKKKKETCCSDEVEADNGTNRQKTCVDNAICWDIRLVVTNDGQYAAIDVIVK